MPPGREKYDGTFFGGDNGFTEWGNTFGVKSQAGKSFTTKRPAKNPRLLEESTEHFEESEKDRYLITYADLITLLLGLFIILYTISNIDSKKYNAVLSAFGNTFGTDKKLITLSKSEGTDVIHPVGQLKEKLSGLIKDHGYNKFVQLEESERGITIHILDQILFNSGSARVESKSFDVLGKIAEVIRGLPNDIRIEGHTDNVPIHSSEFPSNWHLSVARALNTAYYLIDEQKLPQERLSVVGCSEFKPVASNESIEERSKNRRVDIVIINK